MTLMKSRREFSTLSFEGVYQLLASNEVFSRIAIVDSASGEVIRHAVPFSFSTELDAEL